jgi:hypothetical protein
LLKRIHVDANNGRGTKFGMFIITSAYRYIICTLQAW